MVSYIIYRPTGEYGYFLTRPEYLLIMGGMICFGLLIGYLIRVNKKKKLKDGAE